MLLWPGKTDLLNYFFYRKKLELEALEEAWSTEPPEIFQFAQTCSQSQVQHANAMFYHCNFVVLSFNLLSVKRIKCVKQYSTW